MIVVVTGGRDYRPSKADAWALRAALRFHEATLVRHGGCRGADVFTHRVCDRLRIPVEVWFATLNDAGGGRSRVLKELPDYTPILPPEDRRWPSAGPLRNVGMLDGPPPAEAAIAFPGAKGTRHTVSEAKRRVLPVTFLGRGL